jgi:hypothetical protein
MANHVRQQIREAAAALVTGLATTSARVYQNRLHPLADANLPCLLVNADSEEIEVLTMHSTPDLERVLELQVRGVAKAASNLDDTLDTIAKEVETVLGAAGVMPTLIKSIELRGIRVELDDGKEIPVGVIALTYRINYITASNAPDVAR